MVHHPHPPHLLPYENDHPRNLDELLKLTDYPYPLIDFNPFYPLLLLYPTTPQEPVPVVLTDGYRDGYLSGYLCGFFYGYFGGCLFRRNGGSGGRVTGGRGAGEVGCEGRGAGG